MIIERLDLRAFGCFTDLSLDLSAGPKRFHLVYGANESGKSTSLRAITSLLFGMPHVTDDNFLHNHSNMRVGGVLVDSLGNRLECIRRRGRKATLRDADDQNAIEESLLDEMLGGIDRETFLTRFGLSHDELVAGGAAILNGEGDLGQILFAAGAGVSRLRDIQQDLDNIGSKLFSPRGTKTAINAAIREVDEKRKELRQAQVAPATFSDLRTRIDRKRDESAQLGELLQARVVELARLRNYDQALPLLPQWRSALEALAGYSHTPALDDAFTERRRQAMTDRDVAISRQVELENRIAELTGRLESLPVDTAVTQHEAEIQAVFQEVAARDKADRDRVELIRVQRNAERKIIDLLHEFSVEIQAEDNAADRADAIDESVERLRISESLRARIEELALQYERLIAQRNDASDAVETTKRRLADATQELESLPATGDPGILTTAIDSMGAPQASLDLLADQRESVDRLRRRCDNLLRRLSGFDGTAEQAASLQLPGESILQQLSVRLKTAHSKLTTLEDQAAGLAAECDQMRRSIGEQQSSEPLPTTGELIAARQQRDRAIDRLVDLARDGQDIVADIDALREFIDLADSVVDTMRTHHEQVHRRDAELVTFKTIESRLTETNDAVTKAKGELDAVKDEWLKLWQACGVTAGSPTQMQRWLADHEQLVESSLRLADDEKRLEQTQLKIQRAVTRVRSVLASASSNQPVRVGSSVSQVGLFDDPPEDDLLSLYDQAVALRGTWIRQHQQYESLTRRRDELIEELPEAETRFEACQQAVEQWREDWRRVTQSFAAAEQSTPQVVKSMLRRIDELLAKKRERDILATRIRSIGEDELAYASRVERLLSATGQNAEDPQASDKPSPTAIAQSLYQRLQAERTAAKGRETLREQLESSKQRLVEVASQRAACEVVLKQLCAEAGCETADELAAIEQAARESQQWRSSLREVENQLALLAGDQPLDEFVESAGQQQPALLEMQIQQQEAESREVREQLALTQQQLGALQHELDLMDGSGRAADLMQSIQFSAGQISRDAQLYARSKIASLILRRAIDHYRRENQSPVLALAEKYFAQLTSDEYRSLKVDYDAKGRSTLFAVRADASEVPAGVMSTGTADALYLALRLASLEHQLRHSKPIPLIIDDCLIQLDDRRAAAALRAFSELSEKTQVVLFTHHQHVLGLAEQELDPDSFHTHQLSV